jgi:4a-hydroxytetrahydrobiopterin dehydratase
MSEEGWRAFVAAEGIDDWVVLHGGPTAVFRAQSLADAARLAGAVASVPGLDPRTTLTMAGSQLTVRLRRGVFRTEASDIEIARAISAVASAHGAQADRSATREVQLAISAKPEALDVDFWRAVLGYVPVADDNGTDPLGFASNFWMQDLDPAKPLRHAMHIDVSLAPEQAEAWVAAAVAAGGRIVDQSNAPGSWILADKAGNKVCIAAWPAGAPTPAWQDVNPDPG